MSQDHGKTWEKSILSEVYNLSENEFKMLKYTDAHDLPGHLNRLDGANVSVKSSGDRKLVCMGNPFRIFESTGPLHMIVVFYTQDGNVKRLDEIIKIDLTDAKSILFGTNTHEDMKNLETVIKSVPIGRRQTPEEKGRIEEIKRRLNARSGALVFNPKVDSKTQRRLQCSFNLFQIIFMLSRCPFSLTFFM